MIYIISGVAKSGKTTVSQWLLKTHQISVFSTDFLMMALTRGNPTGAVNEKDDDKVVAQAMEPFLEAMIETMIHNQIDYIIEGVHFNPDFAARLLRIYPHSIRLIYLGYADATLSAKYAEWDRYRQLVPTTWFAHHNREQLEVLVQYMLGESIRLREKAIHYGLPYLEITNLRDQLVTIEQQLFSK